MADSVIQSLVKNVRVLQFWRLVSEGEKSGAGSVNLVKRIKGKPKRKQVVDRPIFLVGTMGLNPLGSKRHSI